jgi:hypothetical protein
MMGGRGEGFDRKVISHFSFLKGSSNYFDSRANSSVVSNEVPKDMLYA